MTLHTGVAIVGASATLLALVECVCRTSRRKLAASIFVAFGCLALLGLLPCFHDEKAVHRHEQPALESRPDIDHTEKLMMAHYRRIRQERTMFNAFRP